MQKTIGLKICVGLLVIFGFLSLIVGIMSVLFIDSIVGSINIMSNYDNSNYNSNIGESINQLQESTKTLAKFAGFIALIFGITYVILGYFLWNLNKLARYAVVGLSAILFVLSLISFNLFGITLHGVFIYFLFIEKETKELFK